MLMGLTMVVEELGIVEPLESVQGTTVVAVTTMVVALTDVMGVAVAVMYEVQVAPVAIAGLPPA